MKYPFILFFRYDKYNYIDTTLKENSNELQCTIHIINNSQKLNKLFKQIYPLLVTFGDNSHEYNNDLYATFDNSFQHRIIHIHKFNSIGEFNTIINQAYINICAIERTITRPVFSIFTPSFKSFDKILRAFNSLKTQTLTNWEWIIIDDSPDDSNFIYLKKHITNDYRVRLYRRHENNGYIGNVKNEAVSLCRGKYVLELDHDDEILPFVLKESADLFDNNSEIGFIYMDFINIYENGDNFWYGNHICKGYGSYYCQKYQDKWRYVYITPNINNITLSHLVCCPNHPRIWRKDILQNIGNYCEFLPICDDYEIILRTALNTKIAKIHKMGYIQYMNNENNNFSLIRNAEINRIGPQFISPIYYNTFNIHDEMKKRNAYEDEKYLHENSIIWQRNPNIFQHKYCNLLVNNDYKTQFCIIGLDSLLKHIDRIIDLYKDPSNDFIIIENKCEIEYLWKKLDTLGFDRMKCFLFMGETEERLINYFKICYLSTDKYEIISSDINTLPFNSNIKQRHLIINQLTNPKHNYLEIGVETGYTFKNTHFINKTGIDPDPKCDNIDKNSIIKLTSDEYFSNNNSVDSDDYIENIVTTKFDVIFIDGMHHCENVLRDFNNSIKVLNENGIIFIDDCLPLNYNEQLKIPIKHYYENNILKYGEEWTGDVWKFVYHLLTFYKEYVKFSYFHNSNYRGILCIKILQPFFVDVSYEQLNNYNYFDNFNDYLKLFV
jgi:glycosyltransferase involved in cell wall biosynthesis